MGYIHLNDGRLISAHEVLDDGGEAVRVKGSSGTTFLSKKDIKSIDGQVKMVATLARPGMNRSRFDVDVG